MTQNINLRSILEANKLTGPNYIDWIRNLKIVLRSEKLDYVIYKAVPFPSYEHMDAPTILLKQRLFEEQNRTERYVISKALFRCRMVEGTSAMQHGLKMYGYIERLARVGVNDSRQTRPLTLVFSTSSTGYRKSRQPREP